MIDIIFEGVEVPGINPEFFVLAIPKLVREESKICGDITVVFCSDDYLLQVNRTYLDHDYYTDIITFDYSDLGILSGDLFISLDRVKENAQDFSDSFENELKRVVFHGVLHLCGYKDKSKKDEKIMRIKENYYLDYFVSRETK
ncbi:MAG: hypothetical protein RL264_1630 [Bacteroidota bacterium]|jgi:rRNA maturation RNase YbeY